MARVVSPRFRRGPSDHALESVDPPRNFSVPAPERVRALTIGPPAYALRKRRIEDLEEELVGGLLEHYDTLSANGMSPVEAERSIRRLAETARLSRLNALVGAHNRYYPAEANLPIDLKTGGYLVHGQPWTPEEPWTPARLVACVLDGRR
jgi:hypothetical protein